MNVKKISECKWIIKKESNMNSDVVIFATDSLMKMMQNDKTLEQIKNVSTLPGVAKNVVCMPDAHQGYGFPIGGVAALDFEKGGISPGGIGYDENCGVRLVLIPINYDTFIKDEQKVERLINYLQKVVPAGLGESVSESLSIDDLDDILKNGVKALVKKEIGFEDDLLSCEEQGCMVLADPSLVSPKAKKRAKKQLGTLGSGNHFLEIQKISDIVDENAANIFGMKKDYLAVMIHTGSRGLGHQICGDYLKRIENEYPEIINSLVDRELAYAPSGSELADEFYRAMSAAANFAWCNRHMIMHRVREAFSKFYGIEKSEMKLLYDVCHNIAKIEEYVVDGVKKKYYVHRKGATRAFPKGHKDVPLKYKEIGQPVIIPGSMGTSSYVLYGTPKAMEVSFGSSAHGAGRSMSRYEAKKTLDVDKILKNLKSKNIIIRSASRNGIIDESPECYKDVDEVIKTTVDSEIAKVVAKLIPLVVIKG